MSKLITDPTGIDYFGVPKGAKKMVLAERAFHHGTQIAAIR
jgi:hypothetical protein